MNSFYNLDVILRTLSISNKIKNEKIAFFLIIQIKETNKSLSPRVEYESKMAIFYKFIYEYISFALSNDGDNFYIIIIYWLLYIGSTI